MAYGNDSKARPHAQKGSKQQEVQSTAEQKAHALGWEGAEVSVLTAAERDLRDGGIGVDLDVVGLSMLGTSVDFYMDLGVLQGDTRRKRLSPGRKSLVPDNRLQSAQTRLRNNLYQYSHPLGVLGTYRYIPNGAFMEWKRRHDEIAADFYAARDDYVRRYDELVDDLVTDYRQMAAETYHALESRGDATEKGFTDRYSLSEFQQAVVNKVLSKCPTRHQLATELRIIIKVATWLLPVEAAADDLERERMRAEAQKSREERDHDARLHKAWTEEMEARAKAQAAENEARQEKARQAAELIRAETEAKAQAIRQAQLELAREAIADIANPLDEMLNGLRGRMYDSARAVLDNITKNGRVVGKQVEAITNMVALFKMLNAAGDDELEERINELAASLDIKGTDTKRDTGAIESALTAVADVAINQAAKAEDATRWTQWDSLDL